MLNFRPASFDFGLQKRDPFLELLYRKGIEILLCELCDKIVSAARKIFIIVHESER